MKAWKPIVLALFLVACAGDEVPNLLDSDGSAASFADAVVEANTPEERNLRLCFAIVGIVELQTLRVTSEGGAEGARETLGNIDAFQRVVERTRTGAGLWTNTEISQVVVTLNDMLTKMAYERGLSFAAQAATLDLRAVLTKAKLLAGQGLVGAAIIQDVRDQFAMLDAGTLTIEEGFASCQARIDHNRAKLRAMTGG